MVAQPNQKRDKMTKQQQSNLAKTAIFLIEEAKDEHFDMAFYLSAREDTGDNPQKVREYYSECGTTCCFAGHGPIALKSKINKNDDWEDYQLRVFGIDEAHHLKDWEFLFSQNWLNSRKQAASRALTFLEKGLPESFSESSSTYFTSFSNRKLVDRLSAFVISKKKL